MRLRPLFLGFARSLRNARRQGQRTLAGRQHPKRLARRGGRGCPNPSDYSGPEEKKAALRDLRRQALTGAAPSALSTPSVPQASVSQTEVVLWKSIENSENQKDFSTYLEQYPNGAFAALAQRHLAELRTQAAYAYAFDALKGSDYSTAIMRFKEFLRDYPQSTLAGNAEYWLGETYYLTRDLDDAAASFRAVGDQYPRSLDRRPIEHPS